jgi:DNA-binding CsgD family transcriptional regulator
VGADAAGLRERLAREEGELAAAYRDGRALPYGEMAALALRLLDEMVRTQPQADTAFGGTQQLAQPPPGRRAERNPLSARELEVLRLVAQGLSSKAIGRQLFLAPSTVNYYLTSVFHKLGVDTRAQAVAVAAQRGLF